MTEASPPHRLVATVAPIPGESLLSLVSRACRANVFTHPADLLWQAGVEGTAAFAPFTAAGHCDRIAALLGLAPSEVAARMHPPVEGDVDRTLVWWGGVKTERRFLEARLRRIAPAALAISPHHRLTWMHRALAFCPETFQALISACGRCGQPLGWTRTCGPDRCEHCRAWLRDQDAPLAPDDLRPALAFVGALVDPDRGVGLAAVKALPAPFDGWDAGEVLSAICEFGAAWEHPGASGSSVEGRALKEGRLEALAPVVLTSGYSVLTRWPESLTNLVTRIWEAQRAANPHASTSLRQLGLLGRHLDGRLCATPFRALVRAQLADAARAANLPLKSAERGGDRVELTLAEASLAFNVSKATLGRLVPDSASCRTGRLGRGGSVRFDRMRLGDAVAAYKDGLSAVDAGALLGVAPYMLDAFVEADLFGRVEDADALRLAGGGALYRKADVVDLVEELDQSTSSIAWTCTLSKALARRFSPQIWAAAFRGVYDGQIPASSPRAYQELGQASARGLADDLFVDQAACHAYLKRVRKRPIPERAVLTAEAAGRLVGTTGIVVAELIEAGALRAERVGRSHQLTLATLRAFARDHMLSSEFYERAGSHSANYRRTDVMGPTWILETRHAKVARRSAIEGVEFDRSEPPHPQDHRRHGPSAPALRAKIADKRRPKKKGSRSKSSPTPN